MRLALFSQDMADGAFATVFAGLAHGFALNGVGAIDLVTLQGDMAQAPFPLPPQARHVRLPGGGSLRALPALRRYLLQAQPDVLIPGPLLPNLAAATARLLAPGWRGRLVLSHHHPIRLARRQSWKNSVLLTRLLYRVADGSFAVNPTVRDEAIRIGGLAPERVGCFPNLLPPERTQGSDRLDPGFLARWQAGTLFVSIGRLEPEKNVPLLLRALAKVATQRDARLWLIGKGAQERALRRLIAALGLDDRVALLGNVPSVSPYLRAADAFVTASNEEGFCQALSEAMRAGLPVIGTDALGDGIRYVLADGRAGLLVARGDLDGLAGAMAQMTALPVRRRYGALARARAADFQPGPVGAELLRFIAGLPARDALRRTSLRGA